MTCPQQHALEFLLRELPSPLRSFALRLRGLIAGDGQTLLNGRTRANLLQVPLGTAHARALVRAEGNDALT